MVLTFKVKCDLCNNKKDTDFYVIPLDEQTKSGDYIHSVRNFRMQCKRCGADYVFSINLTSLKRSKK